MVDWFGRWHKEKDYSTYPDEKLTDYDYMAVWIRGKEYEPKTSMENLIDMIFFIMRVSVRKRIRNSMSKITWNM